MLGACLSSLRDNDHMRFVLVCTFMFLFVLFYSFGQGPGKSHGARMGMARIRERDLLTPIVAFAYASEVFPLLNREAGMSFSVS
jgi:hypothetical protein